jgi:hypothetical protein
MRAVADLVEIIHPKTRGTLANVPEKLASEHSDLNRCVRWNKHRGRATVGPSGLVKNQYPLHSQKRRHRRVKHPAMTQATSVGLETRVRQGLSPFQGEGIIQFAHYHFTSA